MKIDLTNKSNFFKITLSFIISGIFLVFGILLRGEYASIATAMTLFGSGGIIITFLYLAVTVTTWPEDVENKLEEFFFFWFEISNTLLVISAIAFTIRFFVIQPFIVRGDSMQPNYKDGQILIVNEISYRLGGDPKRGDVVVFKYPKNPDEKFIKRIIGLPGESVVVKDKQLYLKEKGQTQEKLVKEDYIPYADQVTQKDRQEWQLKDNEFFVLGDNRLPGGSLDSRTFGPLPRENIVGKVWVIVWPLNNIKSAKLPAYSL